MTQLLQQAMEAVSQLPEQEQDTYASILLDELASEERWDRAFTNSPDMLAQLAEEALMERREGKTVPLDPDRL